MLNHQHQQENVALALLLAGEDDKSLLLELTCTEDSKDNLDYLESDTNDFNAGVYKVSIILSLTNRFSST